MGDYPRDAHPAPAAFSPSQLSHTISLCIDFDDMTDLGGISVERREDGSNGAGHGIGEHSAQGDQKHRDLGDSNDADENAASNRGPVQERGNGGDAVSGGQPVDGPRKVPQSAQENHRATFYENYRKEAKEYDDEFMKKHVASAFIIQVQTQLQPDPNQETAALLRVLIHKIDSTTFGGDAPALPQWTGPPRTIVQVQTILYASLFASLLSAFLAMLGKQWLNRYASIDMRRSAIERSQNRQRKLDGIVEWYFDHVMESLPVMLQIALLLLGCGLSRYLWEIDTTVASVVLGATSFGVLFYLFIVFAGAIFDSCPYQTPAANAIGHVSGAIPHVPGLLRSAYALLVEHSMLFYGFVDYWRYADWGSPSGNITRILGYPLALPIWFVIDAFSLGRAILRTLVVSVRRAHSWFFGVSPVQGQVFYDQATKLDFRCIFWMLQTSLDKTIKVTTLKFLGTVLTLSGLSSPTTSAVVVDCFNILTNCFVTGCGREVTITRGSEQLAGISATCFLRAFSCLLSTEPTSAVIQNIRQRYDRTSPYRDDFGEISFYFSMYAIHHLVTIPHWAWFPDWMDYNPSADELIPFSRALAQAAKFEYHRRGVQFGVPKWLVDFALRFLSQDQLPPTSVVVDCLIIIATDLGCDIPDIYSMGSDGKARPGQLFNLIVREYETISPNGLHTDRSKDKATIALLPYAARREENGAVLPISLMYATLDAVQYEHWPLVHASNIGPVTRLWMTAASEVPYTDDIGQSVVDALLQVAWIDQWLSHIPALAWDWLKKRPVLPAHCEGLKWGTHSNLIQMVRNLRDAEVIASYLFVVWSEWTDLDTEGCSAMMAMIREELCGIEAVGYRADLIQRLDYVLSQLDTESYKKQQYEEFRTALLEVDEEATKTLTGYHSTFMCAIPLPCP